MTIKNSQDVRWKQRFQNYSQALLQLKHAVELSQTRALSELERQGLIQGFEFTHELAWNVMKDFLKESGNQSIYGSKDATRDFFQLGLIEDGETWMDMIESRNLSSHTYNVATADSIVGKIISRYFTEFKKFEKTMREHL